MDLWTLAQQTTSWLAANPMVAAVGIGVERAIGGDIWKLVKSKFQDAGEEKKALAEFEAEPEDPGKQKNLAGTLGELLEADGDFAKQLRKLIMKQKPATSIKQRARAGRNARIVQVAGNKNNVTTS